MELKSAAAVLLSQLTLVFIAVHAEYSEYCNSSDLLLGRCVFLKECSVILETLVASEKFHLTRLKILESMRKSRCGFVGNEPLVCCPPGNGNFKIIEKTVTPKKVVVKKQAPLSTNNQAKSVESVVQMNLSINPPLQQVTHKLSTPVLPSLPDVSLQKTQVPLTFNQRPTLQQAVLPPQVAVLESLIHPPITVSSIQPPSLPIEQTVAPNVNPSLTSTSTVNPLLQDCGIALTNKYFHGNMTDLDDFPWIALLEYKTPLGSNVIGCGGTLISNRYVLTAAHCTVKLAYSYKLSSVRLGEYDVSTEVDCLPENSSNNSTYCADAPISVPVEELLVHPNFEYFGHNRSNDIALVRLARDVTFTNYIRPICLPLRPPTLKRFQVSGWGKSFWRWGSNLKYMTYLTGQDNKFCEEIYRNQRVQLFDDQICAGDGASEKSCIGDSGGPLMSFEQWFDGSRRVTIHGILSTIYLPTDTCASRSWPGIFTKVYDQMAWVLASMRE